MDMAKTTIGCAAVLLFGIALAPFLVDVERAELRETPIRTRAAILKVKPMHPAHAISTRLRCAPDLSCALPLTADVASLR